MPLTAPKPPDIPPSQTGLDRQRVPSRVPCREEIAGSTVGVLVRGARTKADVLLVDVGEGPMVVKDFFRKPWWVRPLGRLQVSREARAYRCLESVAGTPRFVGRVDRYAIAMENVDGEQLAFAESRFREGETHVRRLRALIDRMHAAGVFHQDLRGRENVLVRPDGQLVLLDLAGAVCLRPGGLAHRLFGPILRLSDEAAYLKWKALLTPGRFTAREERFLRRFRFWRALWVFNRKRPEERRGARG